jgi:hypothetical protein
MNECLSIKEIPDHPKHNHIFVVYTKSRNYYMVAASKACDLVLVGSDTAGGGVSVGAHTRATHHWCSHEIQRVSFYIGPDTAC